MASTATVVLPSPGPAEVIKGYELTMTESRKTAEGGFLNFNKLHAHGAAIADGPETCARQRLAVRAVADCHVVGVQLGLVANPAAVTNRQKLNSRRFDQTRPAIPANA